MSVLTGREGRPTVRRGGLICLVGGLLWACGGPLPDVDLNDDGVVSVLDATMVSSCIGQDPAAVCTCRTSDIDQDGDVDAVDLVPVMYLLGQSGFPISERDRVAPVIAIGTPLDGARVRSGPLEVVGTLDDAAARVDVNGVVAQIQTGVPARFSATVELAAGPARITVRASDLACNASEASVRVSAVSALDPDLNDDGVVNTLDSTLVSSCVGRDLATNCRCRRADADGDGAVDVDDVATVMSALGRTGFPIHPPDRIAPVVLVSTPAEGAVLGQTPTLVSGSVDDPFASVLVNGVAATVSAGPPAAFSAEVALVEGPNVLSLRATDLACNSSVRTLGVTLASAGELGPGVIAGRVLDDTTGLPIAGAEAVLIALDGEAPTASVRAVTDALGRFRLPSAAGHARVGIARSGHSSAEREVEVVAGRRARPEDARLTPLGDVTPLAAILGGDVSSSEGAAQVVLPAGALDGDRELRLGAVGPQGLTERPPRGYSPLQALELAPSGLSLATSARASLRPGLLPPASTPLLLARFDPTRGAWIAAGPVERSDDGTIEFDISTSGQHALLVADAAPNEPPTPALGEPLSAAAARATPAATAELEPAPRILFARPGARSTVSAQIQPAAALASGAPLRLELRESYDFLAGARLRPEQTAQDFALYAFPAGSTPFEVGARFPIGPSSEFDPLALGQGVLELSIALAETAASAPVRAIGAEGGAVALAGGERIELSAVAAAETLPVLLEPLPADAFPLALPDGFTYAGGVRLDLHGGRLAQPATLSLPAPAGLAPGTVVLLVRVSEIDVASELELVATGQLAAGRIVASLAGLPLPGVVEGGRLAFLAVLTPFGFVSGTVTGPGGVVPGALARVDGLPFVARTDAQGRFALAAPTGSAALSALELVTRDLAHASATVVAGGPATPVALELTRTAPRVLALLPADGALGVALLAVPSATFSEPVTLAAAGEDALILSAGGIRVPARISLAPDRRSASVRPEARLASDTLFELRVAAAIADDSGNTLAADAVAVFRTQDETAPLGPEPGAVLASIPGVGPGATSAISAGPGTAEPGGLAVIVNLATGTSTTLTPNSDGSFAGSVLAARSDRLDLILRDAAGNVTRVAMAPFQDADGSVVVGTQGGVVDGPGGVQVEIPAGALPDGTVVNVTPLLASELPAPAPAELAFAGGVKLDLGGVTPLAPLDLSILAPAGAFPGEQVVVARAVTLRGTSAWTVADRAHFAGGRYTTASPPFPGAGNSGSYAFLRVDDADCVSYVQIDFQFSFELVAVPTGSLGVGFIFPVTSVGTSVMPAVCDSTLEIELQNPDTGALLARISRRAPAAQDAITDPGESESDDAEPPLIVQANTFPGYSTPRVEVRFSEPMDRASVLEGMRVIRFGPAAEQVPSTIVAGDISLGEANTFAVFEPAQSFEFGARYSLRFFGVTDRAGNPLVTESIEWTPFEPPPALARLADDALLSSGLRKCSPQSGCTTSARDVAVVGDTLFVANGLLARDQQYVDPSAPQRLIAVDVANPDAPTRLGFDPTQTNPRALAAVPGAILGTETRDLLLVVGGGAIPGGEVAAKLEIYDVSVCTRRTPVLPNCLAESFLGARLLSSVPNAVLADVPPEWGIPSQVAALNQGEPNPQVIAYVATAGLGLQAASVTGVLDGSNTELGLVRGDFLDVSVLKNSLVVSIEDGPAQNDTGLSLFSPQLARRASLALHGRAARVTLLEDFVVDVDGDGNLGSFETNDGDPTRALDEVFDLAFVTTGSVDEDCVATTPCGELLIVDLSRFSNLAHARDLGVIARIPLPGPAFSLEVDALAKLAFIELRGRGLAVVDFRSIEAAIVDGVFPALVDENDDGRDDRVLDVVPKPDVFAGRIHVDLNRGVAYLNGTSSGVELVQIANRCADLATDQQPDDPMRVAPSEDVALAAEKRRVAAAAREAASRIAALSTAENLGLLPGTDFYLLEQGSGSCFWGPGAPAPGEPDPGLAARCVRTGFQAGQSDHDIEVFVPTTLVARVQQEILDPIQRALGQEADPLDLNLFAVSREAFENAELLNGTPVAGGLGGSDPTGDLGMARQQLILLWLLAGEYVRVDNPLGPPVTADGPALTPDQGENSILARLGLRRVTGEPDEQTGLPSLEGFERALLEEFNFHKSGALVRIKGACDSGGRQFELESRSARELARLDPNFVRDEVLPATRECDRQLRAAAKPAIRAALGRLVLHPAGQLLLLELAAEYRSGEVCLAPQTRDALERPPNDPALYASKRCGNFEEFIASAAIESVRRHQQDASFPDLFPGTPVGDIFQFYCLKVGASNCTTATSDRANGRLIGSDEEANRFIFKALAFIEGVGDASEAAWQAGQDADLKTLATIEDEIDGAFPFVDQVTEACADEDVEILPTSTRANLRACNRGIVESKLGTPEDPGVKQRVKKTFSLRALNRSPQGFEQLTLRLYEGDGVDRANYRVNRNRELDLALNETRRVNVQPVPGDPTRKEPVFPFTVDLEQLPANTPRALAVFLDPERSVPERDKRDNQTGYFYYALDPENPDPNVPGTPAEPIYALANDGPDPLCLARPRLDFDFTIQGRNDSSPLGDNELLSGVGEPALLTYRVKNVSDVTVFDVRVERDRRVVLSVPRLAPGHFEQRTEQVVPSEPRNYELGATLRASDEDGGALSGTPLSRRVLLSVREGQRFPITFFDASALNDPNHPLARVRPSDRVIGAATDGDGQGGGARIRIEIDELVPTLPAEISLVDSELEGASEGLGRLEPSAGNGTVADGENPVVVTGVLPDITGHAVIFYTPPTTFVRDGQRAADFAKPERGVRVRVLQNSIGSASRTLLLRRPPVVLVHGFLSNRKTWNEFQPLVPASGVGATTFDSVPGFDGRFDVIAIGPYGPTARFAEIAREIEFELRYALLNWRPDFAVGRVDAIGHSMGGVLLRRLANSYALAELPNPFHKLIAIGSPLAGTELADKLVAIRDQQLVKTDVETVDPLDASPSDFARAPVRLKAEIEFCTLGVLAFGLSKGGFGALEDFQTTSEEIAQLAALGVPPRSHYLVVETQLPTLGARLTNEMTALWTGLGQFCNLTPDAETGDATILAKTGIEIAKTLVPVLKTTRAGQKFTGKTLTDEERTKQLLDILKSTSKGAAKKSLEPKLPEPVFPSANDRVSTTRSQLGGMPPGGLSFTVSNVDGPNDHVEVLRSPGVAVGSCLTTEPAGPAIRGDVFDANGDTTRDAVCRVIHLLEADPSGALFGGSP